MKHRCDKKYSDDFLRYSGRGIKVCKEWEDDFMSFYTWSINNGYSENLSIDRINNDGNYCPENCRWTNAQVQQNNKSNNHCITFQGAAHTIAEWAQITGLSRGKIKDRLMKCGWDIERALTTP